jgi:hypothetical protein
LLFVRRVQFPPVVRRRSRSAPPRIRTIQSLSAQGFLPFYSKKSALVQKFNAPAVEHSVPFSNPLAGRDDFRDLFSDRMENRRLSFMTLAERGALA